MSLAPLSPPDMVVGIVAGKAHEPAEGDQPETWSLIVEPVEGGIGSRWLDVDEATFDWVRVNDRLRVFQSSDGRPTALYLFKELGRASWRR